MSKAAQLAQKSKLYIAGSAAAAEALTAIAVGYPTILTITGHDGVANGDVVTFALFEGADAADLNGKTAVVKNYATGVTNDTFAVDINTLGKTITIGSATATPAEWTQVKEIRSIKPSAGSAGKIDVTDLDSDTKEYEAGLEETGTVAVEFLDKVSDAGQAAVLAAYDAGTLTNFKITLTGASIRTFEATVTKFSTIPDLAVDGAQVGNFELQINGAVTRS